jgi:hypothetical protein
MNFPLPERNDRDCGVLRQLMSNIAKNQAKKSPHWKRAQGEVLYGFVGSGGGAGLTGGGGGVVVIS